MSIFSTILIGALTAASIPLLLALVLAGGLIRDKDRSESAWALIPLIGFTICFMLVGGMVAWVFHVWWAGPIATTLIALYVYSQSRKR